VPALVRDGVAQVTWREERARADFAENAHPRSAVASTRQGGALLVAVDGRTEAGAGMTLDELAQLLVSQGAVDGLNLDGGGSTTLWARGEPQGGVVNHPSDNSLPDHGGERGVASALGVFAPSHRARLSWTTVPQETRVRTGQRWSYEALAVADDGTRVSYRLQVPGGEQGSLAERADGSARVELDVVKGSPRTVMLILLATTEGGIELTQRLDVEVVE
jgi:hypothetical protein